jgi:hypothetical protein
VPEGSDELPAPHGDGMNQPKGGTMMKTRDARFFLPIALIVCLLPCLARPQPASTGDIQPPQLLAPENGSKVGGRPEFFWTSAVLPRGFRGTYKLKVVPLSPGQDPASALASNSPVHQASMRRTGEAYPADGPGLKSGQRYAWCVQVMDANGNPAGDNQGLSEVFIFTVEESGTPSTVQGLSINTQALQMTGMRTGSLVIDTQPLQMTGLRTGSLTIATQPLVMTGLRQESLTITTQPLVMTGIRQESLTITTQPLVMTGMRVSSLVIDTQPLRMTGIRPESITLNTQPLVMTGIRDTDGGGSAAVKPKPKESKQKLETPKKKRGSVDVVNPPADGQDEPRMKRKGAEDSDTDAGGSTTGRKPKEAKEDLDLPAKDPGTVEGAEPPAGQPDGARMKQTGTGKSALDTTAVGILGKLPSLKTPETPVAPQTPQEGTLKSRLQEKAGTKKTGEGQGL